MSEKDNVTIDFMRKDENFADAFNFYIFDGKPVIKPENLTSVDTAVLSFPENKGKKAKSIKKYRDVVKFLSIKRDEFASYVIFAIENQSEIHYAMPVRNLMYDLMQYESQIREIEAMHRERLAKDKNYKMTSSEYLSGFTKKDKLKPVITLVINFSGKPWDGPTSLEEMIEPGNETFLKFMPVYSLNLIDPFRIRRGGFKKFSSHLKEILLYLKYASDKNQLRKMLHKEKEFNQTPNEVVKVINTLTGSKIKIDEKKGKTDMCKAIEDLIEEGKKEGKKEGKLEILLSMIEDGILSIKQAADRMNMTVANFKKAVNNLAIQ